MVIKPEGEREVTSKAIFNGVNYQKVPGQSCFRWVQGQSFEDSHHERCQQRPLRAISISGVGRQSPRTYLRTRSLSLLSACWCLKLWVQVWFKPLYKKIGYSSSLNRCSQVLDKQWWIRQTRHLPSGSHWASAGETGRAIQNAESWVLCGGGTGVCVRGIPCSQRGQRFPGGDDIQAQSCRRSRSEPHGWGGEEYFRQKKHTGGEDLTSWGWERHCSTVEVKRWVGTVGSGTLGQGSGG